MSRRRAASPIVLTIMLHRLFDPPIAEFFENPADVNGAADRVAVIGVESERETITDQAPNRSRLGDVAGYVAVGPGAVIAAGQQHPLFLGHPWGSGQRRSGHCAAAPIRGARVD